MATMHDRAVSTGGPPSTSSRGGDQVLVQVGAGQAVSLSVEQALALLRALRIEFDQAASSMLGTRRSSPRQRAWPNPATHAKEDDAP